MDLEQAPNIHLECHQIIKPRQKWTNRGYVGKDTINIKATEGNNFVLYTQ
jgi:hypothetical protein